MKTSKSGIASVRKTTSKTSSSPRTSLTSRKATAKILALALILALSLSLFALPVSAASPKGSVSVTSYWSGDRSIKQVTLTDNSAWDTDNGGTIKGTLYITFPQGMYYSKPTAEECWAFVMQSYINGQNYSGGYIGYNGYGNGDYIKDGSTYRYVGWGNGDWVYTWDSASNRNVYREVGYKSGYNGYNGNSGNNYTVTTYRTAAQQEAEARLTDLRTTGELSGWTVDWRPSTEVAATETEAWYLCIPYRNVDASDRRAYSWIGSNDTNVYFRFSVHTYSKDGYWTTEFKTYVNGSEQYSYSLGEAQQMLQDYQSKSGNLPLNVYKTSNASTAGTRMVTALRDRGYNVNVTNTNYNNNNGTATLSISRNGYAGTRTIIMNVEWRDSSSYRCTFTEGNRTLLMEELMYLFE